MSNLLGGCVISAALTVAAAAAVAASEFTYIAPAGTTSARWYSETLPNGTDIRLTRPLRGAQTFQFECGAGDLVKVRATGIVGLRHFTTDRRYREGPDAPLPRGDGVVLVLAANDMRATPMDAIAANDLPATAVAAVATRNPKGGLDLTAEIPKRTDRAFRRLPRTNLMSLTTSADDVIAVAVGERDRSVILKFVRECVAMR